MEHVFYSTRKGTNQNAQGFDLDLFKNLFLRVYNGLETDGYFDENFGFMCIDYGESNGKIYDIELELLLKVKKEKLWPIKSHLNEYTEDDLFDMIEFLFHYVSKPIDGFDHTHEDCGMHWETFDKIQGQHYYVDKINELLLLYKNKFELSENGQILNKPKEGFQPLFDADVPSDDEKIKSRINSAIIMYRRHGATKDDRRQAVRDLSDVLEYIRPLVKSKLTKKDDDALFNIANNFGIRHYKKSQQKEYDPAWLSWIFYLYLSTIHLVLRK